jgi:hypothetical protein
MKRTALPPRRTPIRKVSTKRQRELREYSKKRKAFLLAHPVCQVWQACTFEQRRAIFDGIEKINFPVLSCDIHHMRKPRSTYLNDESTWMAVSRQGHEWIESHKSEARARGWLFNI